MSFIKNWFKKPEVEVADLEEIIVAPEIVLPEKTRRELYDAAVLEVQTKRLEYLLLAGLVTKGSDPEVVKHTNAAIEIYGNRIDLDDVDKIKKEFPKVNVMYHRPTSSYSHEATLELPEVTLKDLASALAKDYLSE